MYVLIPTQSHCCAYLFRDREQATLDLHKALERKTHKSFEGWFMTDKKTPIHIGVEAQNRQDLISKIELLSREFNTHGKMELLDRRKINATNFPTVCTYQISKDGKAQLLS